MKISYVGNTLKVSSNINKAAFDKGFVKPVVVDDKGNQVYRISVSNQGEIGTKGIAFNSVAEGNLELVLVLPVGTTKEQVSLQYGDSLIAAQANLDTIATASVERAAVLAGLFAEEAVEA